MIETAQIVCSICKNGSVQLLSLRDENNKKLNAYSCVECKPKISEFNPDLSRLPKYTLSELEDIKTALTQAKGLNFADLMIKK